MFGSKKDENPEGEMGFFDHVEALRWHIIRSALAILICSCIVGYYYDFVFDKIILGVQAKDFPTYRLLCWLANHFSFAKDICIDHDLNIPLQNTEMFGQFNLLLEYAMILGFVMAFPYVIWELWRFVAPALRGEEAKKTSRVILVSSVFFLLGVLFCYYIIIPFSLNFAVNFKVSNTIKNNFTIDNYIDFFTSLLLAMGCVFEMPMLVYFLAKFGILGPNAMRRVRRYAIVIIALIAGILAPTPDIFTQILIGLPIYGLYELSILIADRVEKNNLRKAAARN